MTGGARRPGWLLAAALLTLAGCASLPQRSLPAGERSERPTLLADGLTETRLQLSDGTRADGVAAVDGDTVILGSATPGFAYVFERQDDGSWRDTQALAIGHDPWAPSPAATLDVHGDVLAVGTANSKQSGSVYVFERGSDGSWRETQELVAADTAADDAYGASVAVGDGAIFVGAYYDDDAGTNSGSVYVFERQPGGAWLQTGKLTASEGVAGDFFGFALAASGDRLAVGAYKDDEAGYAAGAAYVFERGSDGDWLQAQKLLAGDGADLDYFGHAVGIDGDTVAVGAYRDGDLGDVSGSAYVFERGSDGAWRESAKLLAGDGITRQYFGFRVAVGGRTVVASAHRDDEMGTSAGAAYLFERQPDGSWQQHHKLVPSEGYHFGYRLASDGTTTVVQSSAATFLYTAVDVGPLPPVPHHTSARVASGSDDAEERADGRVSRSSSDLELVYDAGGDQLVGVRFTGLDVPAGATIVEAYLQFQADERNAGATDLTIRAEATDSAQPFRSQAFDLSGRPTTAASVAWSPPDWNAMGEAGDAQRTPDLSTVIQEIVDRPGWLRGNALALLVSGSGERTAESYEGDPAGAPLLRIAYLEETPATTNSAPSIEAFSFTPDAPLTKQPTTFRWSLSDPDGDALRCTLDTDGDRTPEYRIDDCLATETVTHHFLEPGAYGVVFTVHDAHGGQARHSLQVQVAEGGPVTIERQVAHSHDDAEQRVDGRVNRSSGDLELVYDAGGDQVVGMRFPGLAIPRGAVIRSAHLQFQAAGRNSGLVSLVLRAEAVDDAAPFASSALNISSRPAGSAAVSWSPPDWTVTGEQGPAQRTPDLSALVQEVIDRPGWTSGNALVLFVAGSGERTAESFDGDPSAAPLLRVTYE